VHTDGEKAAQHGDDGDGDRAHGEEAGVPATGHGRNRSRGLPQDGGGGHVVEIGSRRAVLQSSLPFCHPCG
jgi:hypothetical protein